MSDTKPSKPFSELRAVDASDVLNITEAIKQAEALHSIKNAPQRAGALEATTEDLIEWCHGAKVGDRYWTACEQARWLVAEARNTWDEWEGPKALRDLFVSRFGGDNRPERKVSDLPAEKPPLLCADCKDQGSVWSGVKWVVCKCDTGRDLPTILLEVMNGVKSINKPAPPLPTQEEIDRIKEQQRQNRERKKADEESP